LNKKTLSLVQGALIAAIYAALFYAQNLILPGSASLAVQFRIAELMCIFALWTPSAVWGLTLGCLLSNIATVAQLPMDTVFGTAASFLAALCMWKFRNVRFKGIPILSLIMPAIFNGILVGLEIEIFFVKGGFHFTDFLFQGLLVAIGEIVVVTLGGGFMIVMFEKKGIVEKILSKPKI
jgi:uncharacterized membrane protein